MSKNICSASIRNWVKTPNIYINRQAWLHVPVTSTSEYGEFQNLLASQPSQRSKLHIQRETLSWGNRQWEIKIPDIMFWLPYGHTYQHTNVHNTHTQRGRGEGRGGGGGGEREREHLPTPQALMNCLCCQLHAYGHMLMRKENINENSSYFMFVLSETSLCYRPLLV